MKCPKCDRLVDRDENAALNIVRAGVKFAPKGEPNEAVKRNPGRVILGVDVSQLAVMKEANRTFPPLYLRNKQSWVWKK